MNNLTDFYTKLQNAAEQHEHLLNRALVFGGGNANAGIVLVGEAPGAEEEQQGKPFVGKAGKNLTHFLDSVGLSRHDLYITNVVKVRPFKLSAKTKKPVNRPPNREELAFFTPFLIEEIGIISPKLVVTLGNVALQAMTNDCKITIGGVHGQVLKQANRQIFPLYHPASIIYNQALKDVYAEDLKKLAALLI